MSAQKRVIRCAICGRYKRLGTVRGRVVYFHTHDERVLCDRALARKYPAGSEAHSK